MKTGRRIIILLAPTARSAVSLFIWYLQRTVPGIGPTALKWKSDSIQIISDQFSLLQFPELPVDRSTETITSTELSSV